MKILTTTIARYVFAIPFLVFGLFHFMNTSAMSGMVPEWMPGSSFWVILTGIALIAASISMIIRVWDVWASFLLGVMLLIFVFTMHFPAAAGGDQMAMTMVLKDTAMAGGAWLYAGYAGKSA